MVLRAQFVARYPDVRDGLARALAQARALGDRLGEMGALTLAAMSEAYEGGTAEARGLAREAAALADALTDSDLAGLCEPLVRLGWAEAMLDAYPDAERHTDRGVDIARRTGRLYMLSQLLLCKAYVHLLTCRVGSALELADEAAAIARALGSGELLGLTLAIRALVLGQARPPGDPDVLAAAEEAAAAGWRAPPTAGGPPWRGPCRPSPRWGPETRTAHGRSSSPRAAARTFPWLQPASLPEFLELLTAASLAAGAQAEAEQAAERSLKEAECIDLPIPQGAALRASGRVAAHRGDAARRRAFTDAAKESARPGAVLREVQGLLLAAPSARAAGDATRGGPDVAACPAPGRRGSGGGTAGRPGRPAAPAGVRRAAGPGGGSRSGVGPGPADGAGAGDSGAGRRGPHQPGRRVPALPQPAHGREPRGPGLPQDGRHLPRRPGHPDGPPCRRAAREHPDGPPPP